MIQSVVWKEGLFIRPQHFQQNNFYFMSELMRRTIAMGSNQWGLFDIEINSNALTLGKLLIKQISGVMPDGTLFEIDDSEELLGIDIIKKDIGKEIYLAISLAVPNRDEIYFEHQEKRKTRYRAKSIADIPNLNSGEESRADILFAELNFQLLRGEELKESYTAIKLAQIRDITIDGQVSLEKEYSPTFLHLHQAKPIIAQLKEILKILHFRSENIAEKLRGEKLKEAIELGDYLMLQLVNRTYARLHHFSTQTQLHPSELFLELNSTVAELQVLMSKEKRITNPLVYDHKEQNESFRRLFLELKKLLGKILEKNVIRLKLEKGKYGLMRTLLTDKSLLETSIFIFAVSSTLIDKRKLERLLLNNFRISTVEGIRKLVNHNLTGYKLSPLVTAPREMPYRVDKSYFQIKLTENNIKELLGSAGFAFYLSEKEQKGLSFEFWAVKKR